MINLYNENDFEKLRVAGKLARDVLDYITPFVVPGVSTERLNILCHDFILSAGAVPAPLNYMGYPKSICTSVNTEICHGIPSDSVVLLDGDLINIDITVIKGGYYGDTSRMLGVGKITNAAQRLIDATLQCLNLGIDAVRDGGFVSDIGRAIEEYAHGKGYSVVQDFVGHGIGTVFHDDPYIYHFVNKNVKDVMLKKGMVFTIEPMINEGVADAVFMNGNDWTAYTADGKLSAQFEHTVGIGFDGNVEIFT
ncbi:MAG: type I methionyl aminopeptidase [Rickettsiales bacterium]|jgi:methionyl aminopeptidase|nr:type I methionyl aminopeptidase [Rickettsiales bacterium]